MEEEGSEHLSWDHLPTDPGAQEDNSVTLCDPKPESCSCCFHEEEDPAVLAENAGFSADGYSEQEEATKEDWSQDFTTEGLGISTDNTHMGGILRKRNPQSLEWKQPVWWCIHCSTPKVSFLNFIHGPVPSVFNPSGFNSIVLGHYHGYYLSFLVLAHLSPCKVDISVNTGQHHLSLPAFLHQRH